jgi:hypothetical protein
MQAKPISASYVSQLLGRSATTPSSNGILQALDKATQKSVIPSNQSSAAQFNNLGLSNDVLNLLQGGSRAANTLSQLLGGSSLSNDNSSSGLIGKATSSLLQSSTSANILQAAQNGAAAKKYAAAARTVPA